MAKSRSASMTAFSTPQEHQEMSAKQIEQLQHEIQENLSKLQEVEQKTSRVEEEITHSKRETERRVELMMENGELVHALQQLGCLLQEETRLSEQLKSQAASDGVQTSLLEKRSKAAKEKTKRLAAEILEVKRRLAKLKACKKAAQAAVPEKTSKSKTQQRK
ncbi:uncharacterized protein LOC106523322 isoform X2 [Austrofundulus limnaeus]|uniref:Uncharacterized protein LOC106523322 isoform X2 n=1 Tax=Austrofundulus limnaeus TaxID=52670 RepID=A0A2I4BWN9_AUSLI|nr:PREDICTED: uncharacterized protein LOC106523322 isoform X2 [Austrofundulus limnaeus]